MKLYLATWAVAIGIGVSTPSFVLADHGVTINTADKAALTTLTGIGEVKAQAIIDYRDANGPFAAKSEIQNVSGIGSATYASIKDHIIVETQSQSSSSGESASTAEQGSGSSSSSSSNSSSSGSSSSSSSSSGTAKPEGELSLEAGGDRVVVALADVLFSARTKRGNGEARTVRYTWNFGDGSTSRESSPTHRFEYPGRYVVVVTASSGGDETSDKFIVTAEEAELAVRTLLDGGVEIENLASREIDLSRWTISFAGLVFMLPENSHILGRQTMRLSPETLGFLAGDSTKLTYPNGAAAIRAITPLQEFEPEKRSAPASASHSAPVQDLGSADQEAEEDHERTERRAEETHATSSQVAAAVAAGPWKWWLAMFGLVGLAVGAVVVARRFGKGEWDIIEE